MDKHFAFLENEGKLNHFLTAYGENACKKAPLKIKRLADEGNLNVNTIDGIPSCDLDRVYRNCERIEAFEDYGIEYSNNSGIERINKKD